MAFIGPRVMRTANDEGYSQRNSVATWPFIRPTLEVAQISAGKIEGEQASQGVSIAFEDLLIGSTALHLGYAVATLNVRHFQLIPGLLVVQL